MIPPFEKYSGNLPPGIHESTWDEMEARYSLTPHRRSLLAGLKLALEALRVAGCRRVYIDGSFVSKRRRPSDFDGCWEMADVDLSVLSMLAPALLDVAPPRARQKAMYRGELLPAEAEADAAGTRYLEFFQRDKHSGRRKGIVALNL
jgi:hypothetical protein